MIAATLWILGGLAALAAELVLPGVYLVWVGLSAVLTGAATWALGLGFVASCVLFLALLILTVGLALLRWRRATPASRINAPEAGLAGRAGRVVAVDGAMLRIRVGDSEWPARAAAHAGPLAEGAAVRIVAVEGVTLLVEPGE